MDILTLISEMDVSESTKKQWRSVVNTTGLKLDSVINLDYLETLPPRKAGQVICIFRRLYPDNAEYFKLAQINKERVDSIPKKELPNFLKINVNVIKKFSTNYKFLFTLLLHYPALRLQDYFNLTISRGKVIFKDPVKVNSAPIVIDLEGKHKLLARGLPRERLFGDSLEIFKNNCRNCTRLLGITKGGISVFRKWYSYNHPEDIAAAKRVREHAKGQNHSSDVFLDWYS